MEDIILPISGTLKLIILNKEGAVLEEYEGKNLIVSSGYIIAAELLGGNGNQYPYIKTVAVGTNPTLPTLTDTKIRDAYPVEISSVEYPRPGTVQFGFRVGYKDAVGMKIQEFGLMTTDNRLFSRKTREPIDKTENMTILGTWEINFLDK